MGLINKEAKGLTLMKNQELTEYAGGAAGITAGAVAAGVVAAWGIYEAASGFFGVGYKIGLAINKRIRG